MFALAKASSKQVAFRERPWRKTMPGFLGLPAASAQPSLEETSFPDEMEAEAIRKVCAIVGDVAEREASTGESELSAF